MSIKKNGSTKKETGFLDSKESTDFFTKNFTITSNDNNYKVLRYNKDYLSIDLIQTHGLFRSLILNKENQVVSFAPPKSLHSETFIKKYPERTDDLVAEEFVEGTMINVFWDPCIGLGGSWEIATRNIVGANGRFYNSYANTNTNTNTNTNANTNANANTNTNITFREMFIECCNSASLEYEELNKKYCYSFVMQHPKNRIVVPFLKPKLYLVQVCEIVQTEDGTTNVFIENMDNVKSDSIWASTKVNFPTIYNDWEKYSDLIEKHASMNTPYNVMGFIVRNKTTNERCKIRNPAYEEVRQLRGNQPKLQYQYLSLRKAGKVRNFLNYYPEYKKEFSAFRDQVHLFTNTLFQNYISCYIKKEVPLKEFPDQYKTHMFLIHQRYLNELKEKNLYVTNSVVISYVNEMHTSKLMFCMNYNMRRRNVDFIKAEESCQ
jgi:hypothetical protein